MADTHGSSHVAIVFAVTGRKTFTHTEIGEAVTDLAPEEWLDGMRALKKHLAKHGWEGEVKMMSINGQSTNG